MGYTVDNLALNGGRPAFDEPIYTHQPGSFDKELLLARISDAIDRRRLSNGGPYVQQFEERIAQAAGVRNAVAVSSGTMALVLMLNSLDRSGDVVMPALTFAATANAAVHAGLNPVLCDVDYESACVGSRQVANVQTERTSVVLGVHLWGRICPVDELIELAAETCCELVFDAAHSFGCSDRGVKVGGFGHAEVFSFHATKVVSCFEGGALVTDDDSLAAEVRARHQFGKGGKQGGINAKLSEPAAAMGLTSLDAFANACRTNAGIQDAYRAELKETNGLRFVSPPSSVGGNLQYVIIELDPEAIALTRDQILQILRLENIFALPPIGVPPTHRIEPFASSASGAANLPATERLAAQTISLPAGSSIAIAHVRRISAVLRCVLGDSDRLAAKLVADTHCSGGGANAGY